MFNQRRLMQALHSYSSGIPSWLHALGTRNIIRQAKATCMEFPKPAPNSRYAPGPKQELQKQ